MCPWGGVDEMQALLSACSPLLRSAQHHNGAISNTQHCHQQQLPHHQQVTHLATHCCTREFFRQGRRQRKEESTWNLRIPFGIPTFACITALAHRGTQSLSGLHTAQRQSSSMSSWQKLLNREREMAKLNIILDNLGWMLFKSSFSFTITCPFFFCCCCFHF